MTERAPKPIPRPRKLGACAVAIIDVLGEHGVSGEFFKTKHARVEFVFAGRPLTFHFPCTPRDDDNAAKRVRSKLQKLIAGAGA